MEGLYTGDALDLLRAMPDASVDAVITSPPYLDLRMEYEHVGEEFAYLDWSRAWLAEALRVCRGSLLLNLGRVFRDGELSLYEMHVAYTAREVGWKLLDEIVWWKYTGGGTPGTPGRLLNQHERIYWFAKDKDVYRGVDDLRLPHMPESAARYERKFLSHDVRKGEHRGGREGRVLNPLGAKAGTVWPLGVGKEKGNPHPAPMALDLAKWMVTLTCPPGGVVLDPFAGSGTTGVAAKELGRGWLLFELSDEYTDLAAERLSAIV